MFRLRTACFVLLVAASAGFAEKPNIILIMTDDQGYGDLGVTGNPVIDTPNIDAMAKRSASIKRFYVSPVCAPTRACLMTGRYNYRTRVVDTWIGRAQMDPEEVTIAESLRDAGYKTGIFGKWHLGDSHPLRALSQGFEESLVHKGGGLAQPSDPPENQNRYTNPNLYKNGVRTPMKGYCSDLYFDAALDYMDRCHAEKKPFFVYLPDNLPHGPFHDVPQELYEKYKKKDLYKVLQGQARDFDKVARIFAMIETVDRNVGRVFSKLDELKITENTIVIFMVDNGPNSRRYTAGLRGMKTEVYEGGIRSPFFIQWPARLKPHTEVDRIAAHIDVMPTLLAAAGVEPTSKMDGRNLLPLLENKEVDWPDRYLFIQSHRGDVPVKHHHNAIVGQQWKLVKPSGFSKEQPAPNAAYELYDLVADPGEKKDLIAKHPDRVAAMKTAYETWFDDVSSTRPDNYAKPPIVLGTSHQTAFRFSKQDWQKTEGPGWGTQGFWHVRVERKGTYRVMVLLEKPITGRARVKFGDNLVESDVDRSNFAAFVGVVVDSGDHIIEGEVEVDGKTTGVYQILIQEDLPRDKAPAGAPQPK